MWHKDWINYWKNDTNSPAQHRLATELQLLKHAISMKQNNKKYACIDMQSC